MANVYEALQRAEQERERKISGEDMGLAAPPVADAPRRRTAKPPASGGFFRRLFSFGGSEIDTAGEINKRRISILQPESFVAEQYRTLRGRIDSIATQRPVSTIAVVSANAGEGKSSCSINLAAVTALSVGRKVLLVDCDLRRPKVHTSLGLEPKAGLGEILMGQASFDDAVVPVEGIGLDAVAVRNQPTNPSELLASAEMRQFVAEASSRYDRVILDTPAALGLPDAKTISEYCDGVVMVVRADVTPRQDVETALELIDRNRVLGMVINGTALSRRQYGYY
jgi:capsular exopolysaccharide synthesis family protein